MSAQKNSDVGPTKANKRLVTSCADLRWARPYAIMCPLHNAILLRRKSTNLSATPFADLRPARPNGIIFPPIDRNRNPKKTFKTPVYPPWPICTAKSAMG